MLLLSFAETLRARPEALFAVLSEPKRRPEWQSSLRWVRLLSDGPTRVGTRWRERLRLGLEFELAIVAHESPSRWAERVGGAWGEATLELSFEPVRAADSAAADSAAADSAAADSAAADSAAADAQPEDTRLGVELRLLPHAWWHRPLRALAPLLRQLLRSDLRRAATLARAPSASP